MNIRLEYQYRDAGNYKNWGEIVFSNPRNLAPEVVTQMAEDVLIDGEFFVASWAHVPDLHFPDWDPDLDHDLHEMVGFRSSDEAPNDPEQRTIEDFVEALGSAASTTGRTRGWPWRL